MEFTNTFIYIHVHVGMRELGKLKKDRNPTDTPLIAQSA